MILNTAAEGITLAKKLENESAEFYRLLAREYPEKAEFFQVFAKENEKYIVQIERAYYEVITDALEGCFALNLDSSLYEIKTTLSRGTNLKAAVEQALEIERKIIQFYTDSAKQCESLMADVPRTFTLLANKRKNRISKILSIQS